MNSENQPRFGEFERNDDDVTPATCNSDWLRTARTWASPPTWVPPTGHSLRKPGVYFDAVRVPLPLGEQVAVRLTLATDGDPGPIINDRDRRLYFLVDSGRAHSRTWPPTVIALTSRTDAPHDAYIGVPGLYSATWPLRWRRAPIGNRLVDTHLLYEVLRTFTT
jgi:hypothetical protein